MSSFKSFFLLLIFTIFVVISALALVPASVSASENGYCPAPPASCTAHADCGTIHERCISDNRIAKCRYQCWGGNCDLDEFHSSSCDMHNVCAGDGMYYTYSCGSHPDCPCNSPWPCDGTNLCCVRDDGTCYTDCCDTIDRCRSGLYHDASCYMVAGRLRCATTHESRFCTKECCEEHHGDTDAYCEDKNGDGVEECHAPAADPPPPACTTDADCPADGWYCTAVDAQEYRDYSCVAGECVYNAMWLTACPRTGWYCVGDIREHRTYFCDFNIHDCIYEKNFTDEDCNDLDGYTDGCWYDGVCHDPDPPGPDDPGCADVGANCVAFKAPCSDDNPCTENDECSGGVCSGDPITACYPGGGSCINGVSHNNHCADGVKNCDEEDIDCGGVHCSACNQPPDKPGINPNYPEGEAWNHCAWGTIPQVAPGTAITFYWTYFDPDGDHQIAYEIQVDNSSAFTVPKFNNLVNIASTTYTLNLGHDDNNDWIPELVWATDYWWRVRVKDNHNNWSEWSLPNKFTTSVHAYPFSDFTWSPEKPSQGEVVEFNPDASEVFGGASIASYLWVIAQGDGDFVHGTDANSQYPRIVFTTTNNELRLRITDSFGFFCQITKEVDVQMPLPEWWEVAPIGWIRKLIAGVVDFANSF